MWRHASVCSTFCMATSLASRGHCELWVRGTTRPSKMRMYEQVQPQACPPEPSRMHELQRPIMCASRALNRRMYMVREEYLCKMIGFGKYFVGVSLALSLIVASDALAQVGAAARAARVARMRNYTVQELRRFVPDHLKHLSEGELRRYVERRFRIQEEATARLLQQQRRAREFAQRIDNHTCEQAPPSTTYVPPGHPPTEEELHEMRRLLLAGESLSSGSPCSQCLRQERAATSLASIDESAGVLRVPASTPYRSESLRVERIDQPDRHDTSWKRPILGDDAESFLPRNTKQHGYGVRATLVLPTLLLKVLDVRLTKHYLRGNRDASKRFDVCESRLRTVFCVIKDCTQGRRTGMIAILDQGSLQ